MSSNVNSFFFKYFGQNGEKIMEFLKKCEIGSLNKFTVGGDSQRTFFCAFKSKERANKIPARRADLWVFWCAWGAYANNIRVFIEIESTTSKECAARTAFASTFDVFNDNFLTVRKPKGWRALKKLLHVDVIEWWLQSSSALGL